VLYWADDALIGFNLLLQDGETLLDKFFCMETTRGPALNLYFVSWFVNVRLCLERGLTRYQSGQAAYANKLRLGSRLIASQMYFRHRQPLVNRALQWVAPLLADDPVPQRGVGAARMSPRPVPAAWAPGPRLASCKIFTAWPGPASRWSAGSGGRSS
jgi:hypothetical protein